jgi:murein DD-endopeptidase MepM/ murein hydrolase activator NlpD
LSVDPILNTYLDGKRGGGGVFYPVNINLYHYGGNNPLVYTDPDGRVKRIKANGGVYYLPYKEDTPVTFIRGFTGNHKGVDSIPSVARPLRNYYSHTAVADGVVTYTGKFQKTLKKHEATKTKKDYGNFVEVFHGYTKDKKAIHTRYAHNDYNTVKNGAKVKKDDRLGNIGDTGRSGGAHSHFELHIDGVRIDSKNKNVEDLVHTKATKDNAISVYEVRKQKRQK